MERMRRVCRLTHRMGGQNAEGSEPLARRNRPVGPHYKWVALTNATLGVLMTTIDSSIVLISLPVIFKGLHINPLAPDETGYFLWMLLGYMVVTATLLVTFGCIPETSRQDGLTYRSQIHFPSEPPCSSASEAGKGNCGQY